MPTDEVATDKAYVKKHKLNHTLNELFLAITQSKPENPFEFAKSYFESKLPKETSSLNVSAALSNLNTINRVNRIVVKQSKELTEEELLESELVTFTRKDDTNETFPEQKKTVTYKSDLKKRELASKHKQALKSLVEEQMNEMKPIESDQLLSRSHAQSTDEQTGFSETIFKSDDEDDVLLDEMTTNSNFAARKRNKKKAEDKRISFRASFRHITLDEVTILSDKENLNSTRHHYVCSACGKSKNETLKEEPIEPTVEQKVDSTQNKSIAKSENIFDFLIKKAEETKQPKETKKVNDSFDEDNIESASQVSGPRPITPFDSGTSRSLNQKLELNQTNSTGMPSGVLGWLLTTQQHTNQTAEQVVQEKNSPKLKTSSDRASNVSKASTVKNKNISINSNESQHWRANSSSTSELSIKFKVKK